MTTQPRNSELTPPRREAPMYGESADWRVRVISTGVGNLGDTLTRTYTNFADMLRQANDASRVPDTMSSSPAGAAYVAHQTRGHQSYPNHTTAAVTHESSQNPLFTDRQARPAAQPINRQPIPGSALTGEVVAVDDLNQMTGIDAAREAVINAGIRADFPDYVSNTGQLAPAPPVMEDQNPDLADAQRQEIDDFFRELAENGGISESDAFVGSN